MLIKGLPGSAGEEQEIPDKVTRARPPAEVTGGFVFSTIIE
jgi:hypothetical protein